MGSSTFQQVIKYIYYYITASNGKGHGIHSPFVFDFITKVLNDQKKYPEYEKAESIRKRTLVDKTVLTVDDYGAGSVTHKTNRRSIASITRTAIKPPKFSQLFFRMIRRYQPSTILEIGTSLGITTTYLSLASPAAKVITLEGAKEIANKAGEFFKELQLSNIQLVQGNFNDTLSSIVNRQSSIDFAFIDGNHRYEPTISYFKTLLSKTNNDSILVFDDIHWSGEMERAWKEIKQHPSVRATIDLYFIGIVVFRQEFREKQHFRIRF